MNREMLTMLSSIGLTPLQQQEVGKLFWTCLSVI